MANSGCLRTLVVFDYVQSQTKFADAKAFDCSLFCLKHLGVLRNHLPHAFTIAPLP